MYEMILLLGLGLANLSNSGSFFKPVEPDPHVRTLQLLRFSETSGQTRADLSRIPLKDQPTALTPIRMNGTVGP